MKKIELLAPAGDLERAKIAILYGADAVYVGGKKFSLRARASNFEMDHLKELAIFAKERNARVYVTTNIIAHNKDLEGYEEYILELERIGIDAIIVADIGLMSRALRVLTKMEVHASTQLSISNIESIKFFTQMGCPRVVLARECSMKQIEDLCKYSPVEIETFIHGAMCSSYSGKCVLSNYMTNRDANRGGCAQSCRWLYRTYDENKGKINDNIFTFSSKDLQGLRYLPRMIEANVSSLKVEGRMKTAHYLATVIGTYRRAIDQYYKTGKIDYEKYENELKKCENRKTSIGFFEGNVSLKEQIFDFENDKATQEYVAVVLDYNPITKIAKVEQRNYFQENDLLEVYGYDIDNFTFNVSDMIDEEGEKVEIANNPKKILFFKIDKPVKKDYFLRKVK